MRIVIIGNGITGITAALEIRRLQPEWTITIVSGESPWFYSRPALMYLYMGHMRFEDTKPYEDWFWKRQRLELVHDWVREVDAENRLLRLADATEPLPFDRLLVATGSKPNRFGWPGQDLDGVQGFYDLQDLEKLERATDEGIRTAVVVGGGLIGIELAECLHSRGAHVVMLVRESSYWNNVLPAGESAMVNDVVRESGIELRLETELAEIEDDGRGRACSVTTEAGERIPCQLVGLTAGVSPNVAFLEGSGIAAGRGVLVSEGFETSVDGVFSAGDCAEIVPGSGAGSYRAADGPEGEKPRNTLEQLWYTGKMQGEVAGRIIAGREATYDRGIWFNSAKFLDLEWHTYGRVPGAVALPDPPPSRSLYWEHADKRHCLHIAHDDGIVRGMNAMGIRHRHRVWERWIRDEREVGYVLDHLADANFDPELFSRHEKSIVGTLKEQLR